MVGPPAQTARLRLEPLSVAHAGELLEVLSSPTLHRHIGGHPPTLDELRQRLARLEAGSPDPSVEWRNWLMRRRSDGRAVGWLQATLTTAADRRAEVAWVVGAPHQGGGLATEAAGWLLDELGRLGVAVVTASIAPANEASMAVARHLGMTPGALDADGEAVWARRLPVHAHGERLASPAGETDRHHQVAPSCSTRSTRPREE